MSEKTEKSFIFSTIKGIGIMIIAVLLGILIFAAVIKVASLPDKVIKPVNQFIKAIAVFLGCLFSIKNDKGLIKGAFIGALGMILVYLVFAIIGGNLSFGLPFIADLVFGLLAGGISGILSVNVVKKKS